MEKPTPIHAFALSEAGHEIKIQLPPRTTRAIRIREPITAPLVIDRALALRAIILIETQCIDFEVLLYNGGFDTQWITNGQIIAHAIPAEPAIGPSRPGK